MRLFLLGLLSFFVIIGSVQAQGIARDDLLQVRLVPERTRVEAGQKIWLGIEQTIKPHWHTYWQNPGDSGTMPFVNWTMPDGFKVSDIYWPVPKKLPFKTLLNYGYEGQVVLLQELQIPAEIPDDAFTLTADLDVLVCQEECIPVSLTKEITFNQPGAIGADNSEFINVALSQVPEKSDISASYTVRGNDLILSAETPDGASVKDAVFYPIEWGVLENAAAPDIAIDGEQITITQKRGNRNVDDVPVMNGVLQFETREGETKAIQIAVELSPEIISTDMTSEGSNVTVQSELNVITALLFAFLGGLILNLMPCVFPVLSLKALSLVKLQDKVGHIVQRNGLAYAAGVILSFVLVAVVLITLKGLGAQIGWGFQLQNPVIVSILAYTLFLVGLNFSGVFDLSFGQFGGGKLAGKITNGERLGASFFTGVLATIVAAPCVAPFMASAIGYALTRSAVEIVLVFAALGGGLAAPYVLLCFVPRLQKFMPKPGAWMNTFKQFLAFPMFASAAWLIWVLDKQAGSMALLGILMGMIALAFGLWILMHRPEKGKKGRKRLSLLAVLSFLIAIGFLPVGYKNVQQDLVESPADVSSEQTEDIFGQAFTPQKLDAALQTSDPVFVEMTAAWCITCKVNHATSLNIEATKRLFKEQGVNYLIGDWTNQNPEITKYLEAFGRSGVPIYVFYGAPDTETGVRPDPVVLPQILTPGIVKDTITAD